MSDRRSALDSALDLVLYAPVGLAVELQRIVPDLAREGRTRVDQRVALARFVGRHAVRVGRRVVEQRVDALLSAAPLTGRGRVTPPVPSSVSAETVITDEASAASAEMVEPSLGAADLPIPGYDSLSASQVVTRLVALSADELSVIAEYESAHRRRRTVLGKVDQLRSRVA